MTGQQQPTPRSDTAQDILDRQPESDEETTYPYRDEDAGVIRLGPAVSITMDGKIIDWGGVVYQRKHDVPKAPDELAIVELARVWHDYHCPDGPSCKYRNDAASEFRDELPALISVAVAATSLGPVDWLSLSAPVGCKHTYTYDRDDEHPSETIECGNFGSHDTHKAWSETRELWVTWEASAVERIEEEQDAERARMAEAKQAEKDQAQKLDDMLAERLARESEGAEDDEPSVLPPVPEGHRDAGEPDQPAG